MRKLTCALSLLSVLFLAACGGGASLGDGGGDGNSLGGGTTGGGTTGGNTATGVPANLTIEAAQTSIVADGQSTSLLTATLTDTAGVAIKSKTLDFETNAGGLTAATATTDTNGRAMTRLKAGILLGRATVTVREPSSGLSASVNVVFTAGAAAHVAMNLAPAQIRPAGLTSVDVVVTDANGLPVGGELVSLGTTSNLSGGSFAATVLTTDNNGRTTTTYQAGPNAGTDKLQASLAAAGVNASATLTVSASATTVTGISVTLGSSTAVADGISKTTISARVNDATGAPVPGSTVNFSTTAGTLVAASAMTGTDGVAQVALKSPILVGNATVIASTSGLSDSKTITFLPGAVASIALAGAPTTVQPGGMSSIRATAFDANGNRVPGVTISFRLPTASVSNGGRFSTSTLPTDDNGEAATQYIAPSTGATDTINAKSTSGIPAPPLTITISNSTAVVTGLNIEAATSDVAAGGDVIVRATVDTDGSLSGIPVNFSTSAGSLSPATAQTDATGVAAVHLTAPINLATVQLSATTGNFSAQTQVQVTAGAPDHAVISVASSPVVPGGNATISAQILDADNNPVANQIVQFRFALATDNATGATIAPASAVTDSNGNVSVTYKAGTTNGVDAVTLTFGNGKKQMTLITVDSSAKPVGGITLLVANVDMAAGKTQTVVATVTDESGSPIAGQVVNFNGTAGTFDALVPASGMTDSQGKLRATYHAPHLSGFYDLSAASGGYSSTQGIVVNPDVPNHLALTVTPTTLAPSGRATVSATVFDQYNNRIDGALQKVQVTFSAATQGSAGGGSFVVAQNFVDLNGQATTTYIAPNAAGPDTIKAKVSGVAAVTQAITISNSADLVGGLTLTALATSVPADGQSKATFRATVTGTDGSPLSGQTVSFSASAGSPVTGNGITDDSGNAVFQLTAGQVPGTATVKADIGGFTKTATVTFTAGAAKSVAVVLNPPTVAINGTTTVSARVTDKSDGSGNPVPGVTVNFSVQTNNSHGTLRDATATTNASGVATTTYTAGNQATNGQKDTIVAKVAGVATNGTADLTINVLAGSLTVTSAQPSIIANGTSTTVISAKLLDTNGNAIPNAQIAFTTNAGTLTGATPATSDANGIATITLKSGTVIGTATVTASDTTGVTNSVNVVFKAGAAKNIVLSLAPTTVSAGGTTSVGVQVTDAKNNAVPNAVVTLGFATPANNVSGGRFDTSLLTTDSNGRASTVYTAGTTLGTDKLRASVAGASAATQNLTVQAGVLEIGSITLKLGNPTAQVSGPTFDPATGANAVKTAVTATVLGSDGKPVIGQVVTFSTSASVLQSGANPPSPTVTATTDSNGKATLSLLSPTQIGNAQISASIGGNTVTQAISFTARPAFKIVVSASPTDLVPGGAAAASALVLDDNGNPVPDVKVTFKAMTATQPGGATFAVTTPITTSANGTATTQYIAPTTKPDGTPITAAVTDSLTAVTAGVPTSNAMALNISPNNALVTGLTLSAETPNVQTGKTVQIRATVTVSNGSLAGIPIAFETPTPTNSSLSTLSPSTDVNGVATTTLTAPKDQGTVHLIARVGNFTQTLDVPVVSGDPNHIHAGVASSPVVPGGQATITAQVVDASENPVGAGHMVRFAITSANTSKSGFDFISGFTDDQGIVQVKFYAGTALGNTATSESVTITTDDSHVTTVGGPLSISIDPAASRVGGITLSTANSRMTVNGTQQVLVTLTDEAGKPLAGQSVSLTATDGSFPAGPFVTGADGKVAATYTAAADDSQVTLTASSGGFTTSKEVTVVADTPTMVVVNAAPIQIAPNATTSITATVFDADGNAVPNTTVAFTAATGTLSVSTATTDDSGNVTVSFKGSTAGSATITAAAKKGGTTVASGTTTVLVAPNVPVITNLTVTALATSIPADGTSTAVVRAHVTDSTGAPISGVTVNFTSTVGAGASPATDSNGNADFTQTAANVPGSATVTAVAGGFSKSATVTFTAGAPASVTLGLSPPTVAINGQTTVNAIVLDGQNNPVPGVTVNFSVQTNNSHGTLRDATATTNASGVATTTYTAGNAISTSSSDTIRANVAGVMTPASATLTVVVQVGTLKLIAANDSVIADTANSTTLTATLVDQSGHPIKGQNIVFRTNAGSITPATASTTGVASDANGQAFVTLMAPTTVGNATITANVSGSTAAAVVQFVAGPVDSITLVASPATVAPGAQSMLRATVIDANSNPVPGADVLFNLMSGDGSIDVVSATTNAVGQATTVYTAGSTGATILADAGNSKTATTTVTSSAAAVLVGKLTLTLGASSVAAGFPAGVTLSAKVVDTTNTPVAGKTVNFSVTDGTLPGGGALDSATTDSNGVARLKLTPPTHTTPVLTIRAEADGFADEQTLKVVPGAADASMSTITANPTVLLADGVSTSTVTVVLNDVNGNALPDGTTVILKSTAGTLATTTASLTSGRATFSLKAPAASGSATISVPAVSGLTTNVTFTGASTGDPAALSFVATNTQIYVAGVGQSQQSAITVTVLDSAGHPIDESKYNDATLDNLQAHFVTRPNGGESLSGTAANGTIATNDPSGTLNVRTTNGVATLTLQSGTISGIVEVQFSVRNFANTGIAATGLLPQVSIASGSPASIVFSGPITNAVEDLHNGNYRLHGKVDVRDRFGNFVPDGTVVNFALIDSAIVHDNSGSTSANSPTLSRAVGASLITRRCATQPVPNGEASGCVTDGSLGNADFQSSITRNDHPRGIQMGDLILLRDTVDSDKRRSVAVAPSSDIAVDAQSDYLKSVSNAMFWVGSSLSGAAISGFAADGTTMKPGTGVVKGGLAEFRVDYPANVRSILSGCYGYNFDGSYDNRDLRDAVPQSRQVVVSAEAGSSASAINAGDFCFKAVAGATLTPASDAIVLSPGQTSTVGLDLRDGGDTIFMPYLPLQCFVAKSETGSISPTVTVGVNSDGDQRTGVNGVGSVIITRAIADTGTKPVTVRCIGADASTDITVSP